MRRLENFLEAFEANVSPKIDALGVDMLEISTRLFEKNTKNARLLQ